MERQRKVNRAVFYPPENYALRPIPTFLNTKDSELKTILTNHIDAIAWVKSLPTDPGFDRVLDARPVFPTPAKIEKRMKRPETVPERQHLKQEAVLHHVVHPHPFSIQFLIKKLPAKKAVIPIAPPLPPPFVDDVVETTPKSDVASIIEAVA
jgi:hypothetical protein